jgi:hypothetical protein
MPEEALQSPTAKPLHVSPYLLCSREPPNMQNPSKRWCHYAELLMDLKNRQLYLKAMEIKNKPQTTFICLFFFFPLQPEIKKKKKKQKCEKYNFD